MSPILIVICLLAVLSIETLYFIGSFLWYLSFNSAWAQYWALFYCCSFLGCCKPPNKHARKSIIHIQNVPVFEIHPSLVKLLPCGSNTIPYAFSIAKHQSLLSTPTLQSVTVASSKSNIHTNTNTNTNTNMNNNLSINTSMSIKNSIAISHKRRKAIRFRTRGEAFFSYGIDALLTIIMLTYLISIFLFIIIKIMLLLIQNTVDITFDDTKNNNRVTWYDYEDVCFIGQDWRLVFATVPSWMLIVFMSLRALKIELNRFDASFCSQLMPFFTGVLGLLGCIYHCFVVLSFNYVIRDDGHKCIIKENNWESTGESQAIVAGILVFCMTSSLVLFLKPVCNQKRILAKIKEKLDKSEDIDTYKLTQRALKYAYVLS